MPDMTPLQKIEASMNVLDKLPSVHGRVLCGYVWTLSELLEGLRKDILELQKASKVTDEPQIEIEEVEVPN